MIELSLFLINGILTKIVFPLKMEVNMFGTFPRDYQISQHSQKDYQISQHVYSLKATPRVCYDVEKRNL